MWQDFWKGLNHSIWINIVIVLVGILIASGIKLLIEVVLDVSISPEISLVLGTLVAIILLTWTYLSGKRNK
ncbi:hypothetical protein ACFYU8_18185 [Brevibacillus sp. NPDC003359]|uniref:hypothetical protein n=1 Tax=unclassified Brevibacillus TaxID=2684853 RepID=UPI003674AE8C